MDDNHEERWRYLLIANELPAPGYRLQAVPESRIDGDWILSPPPFDKLLEEFRAAHRKYANDAGWLRFTSRDLFNEERDQRLGEIDLAGHGASSESRYIFVSKTEALEDWLSDFSDIAVRAAVSLPIEVFNDVAPCKTFGDDFSRWIAVIWLYSSDQTKALIATPGVILAPFLASIEAIVGCEHLKPAPITPTHDVWSVPLTRPEIAKRKAQAKSLTRAGVERHLVGLNLRPYVDESGTTHKYLYQVRLNDLDDELKLRLSK